MTATDASTGVGEQVEIHSLQERYKNGSLETVSQDEYKPLEFDPDRSVLRHAPALFPLFKPAI